MFIANFLYPDNKIVSPCQVATFFVVNQKLKLRDRARYDTIRMYIAYR